MTKAEERARNRLAQQEDKKWNQERRLSDRLRSLRLKRIFGSSQVPFSWYPSSRKTLAEMIALDVHRKIFSGQEDKKDLSHQIGNRVSKMMFLYGERAFWTRWEYHKKNPGMWPQGERLQEHYRMHERHFMEKYGALYEEAQENVKARKQLLRAEWDREIAERRANAELRKVPAVQETDPQIEDGGGS